MATAVEVHASLRHAREILRRGGHPCRVSARDFLRWLQTDTPYPNPSFDEVVSNPFFVVHELVEIEEVKRMGLRITKDVILREMGRVNDAHLVAARAEFEAALRAGALDHLRGRYRDLEAWCRDPLLTARQRRRYESLRRWARKEIRSARAQTDSQANR